MKYCVKLGTQQSTSAFDNNRVLELDTNEVGKKNPMKNDVSVKGLLNIFPLRSQPAQSAIY